MSGATINPTMNQFRPSRSFGSASANIGALLVDLIGRGTAASDEQSDQPIKSGLRELKKSADIPLGLTSWTDWVIAKEQVDKLTTLVNAAFDARQSIGGMATLVLTRLGEKGIIPNKIFRPKMSGIGMSLSGKNREAYFEFRTDSFGRGAVQGLLFLTRFDGQGPNSILHLYRNDVDEISLAESAVKFVL